MSQDFRGQKVRRATAHAADRMKATKVHRVPLTAAAVALLGERQADDVPLFKVSHSNATLNVLRKNDGDEFTVHGFRSSFEDWAAETPTSRAILSSSALPTTSGRKSIRRISDQIC
jgi:integrase